MTIPEINLPTCNSMSHYTKEKMNVIGIEVSRCSCNLYSVAEMERTSNNILNADWKDPELVLEEIYNYQRPKAHEVTPNQLHAIAKKQMGMELSPWDKEQLYNFQNNYRKAQLTVNEYENFDK